ncbi:hypothetical protein [Kribbella sp. C-35]|uniref:hypothetical protein n=1 Tax=Kribbella sp. C-35 TaxID=2789276 RepID=UPI00397A233E
MSARHGHRHRLAGDERTIPWDEYDVHAVEAADVQVSDSRSGLAHDVWTALWLGRHLQGIAGALVALPLAASHAKPSFICGTI